MKLSKDQKDKIRKLFSFNLRAIFYISLRDENQNHAKQFKHLEYQAFYDLGNAAGYLTENDLADFYVIKVFLVKDFGVEFSRIIDIKKIISLL